MICIVSSSSAVSGAEIVLKDHIMESKHEYILLVPDKEEVKKFFSDIPSVKQVYVLPTYMKVTNIKLISRIRNISVIIREFLFIHTQIKNGIFNKVSAFYGSNVISCMSLGMLKLFHKNFGYILHVHDMMTACSYTPIFKRLCKNMNTITVSQKCKEELINIAGFNEGDITVVYNGINTNDFTLKNSASDGKKIVIGYAGNIIERKGVLSLVKAFKKLYEDFNNTNLKISYHLKQEEYFDQVDKIIKDFPHSYENNSREEMNVFYSSIDILVVPSMKDPLPTTVLEGMACGLIVLGSLVDGIPEMLTNEFLFEPNNVDSIYMKLKWAVENIVSLKDKCMKENPKIIHDRFLKSSKIRIMDSYFDKYEGINGSDDVF